MSSKFTGDIKSFFKGDNGQPYVSECTRLVSWQSHVKNLISDSDAKLPPSGLTSDLTSGQ